MSSKLQKLVQRGEPDRESLMELYREHSSLTSSEKHKCLEFIDQYFDTPDFQLAAQNIWLRFRIDSGWTLQQENVPDITGSEEICHSLSERLKYYSTSIAYLHTYRDTQTHLEATAFAPNQFYISGCGKDVLPTIVAWCLFDNLDMVAKLNLPITHIPLVDKPHWIPDDNEDIDDLFIYDATQMHK
jgi:hypothetical protein